jgi:hypothetical protein
VGKEKFKTALVFGRIDNNCVIGNVFDNVRLLSAHEDSGKQAREKNSREGAGG